MTQMRRSRAVLAISALTGFTAALQPLQQHIRRRSHIAAADDDIVLEHDYKRSADHPGSFSEDVIDEIDELIALRQDAKKNKAYKQADALRDELSGCYDVYVDDALREWRAGAPPEPEQVPIPVYDGPTSGGFGIVDEEAEWERRLAFAYTVLSADESRCLGCVRLLKLMVVVFRRDRRRVLVVVPARVVRGAAPRRLPSSCTFASNPTFCGPRS